MFVSDLNHFILPWQSVVFKNINIRTGKLVHYNSLKKYKKNNVPLWVVARLYLFCENNNFYPVYACNQCTSMSGVSDMTLHQSSQTMENLKCIHSRMAEIIVTRAGDWRQIWPLNVHLLDNTQENLDLKCNTNVKISTLCSDEMFLAAYYDNRRDKISLLFSLTSKTKSPLCNSCTVPKCKCFREYKRQLDLANKLFNVNATDYWDRRKRPVPEKVENYEDETHQYGFNKHEIRKITIRAF